MSTLSTLRSDARVVIPEINQTSAVSDADLLTILNYAAKEFLRRVHDYVTASTFATVAGQFEYSFATYVATYGRLHKDGLWWNNGSRWVQLDPTTRAVLSEDFPNWQGASNGSPARYFIEGSAMTVHPPPTTAGAALFKLYHYPRSVNMSADAQYVFTGSTTVELTHLIQYEDILFDFVRAKVYDMLNKPALAQSKLTLFYQRCQEARGELAARPDLVRDYRPRQAGTFFQHAQSQIGAPA